MSAKPIQPVIDLGFTVASLHSGHSRPKPSRRLSKDEYFVPTQAGFLVVDVTAWGRFLMLWGALLALAGIALLGAQGWARWFAIVVVSLNILAQLGFAGDGAYPLWSLTAIILNIVVLYALTARWAESTENVAVFRD